MTRLLTQGRLSLFSRCVCIAWCSAACGGSPDSPVPASGAGAAAASGGGAGAASASGVPGTAGGAGASGAGQAAAGSGGTGGTEAGRSAAGAGGAAGDCALATQAGARVVVACTQRVTLKDAGNGFRPSAPSGSTCDGRSSFALDLTSALFNWDECVYSATAPWMSNIGMRTLDAGQLKTALDALHMVTLVGPDTGSGADKPTLTLEVTTGSATKVYTDSFYAYNMTPGAVYVDNIDAAFGAMRALVVR